MRIKGPNGAEAVSVSILPDFMSAKDRAAALGKKSHIRLRNGRAALLAGPE